MTGLHCDVTKCGNNKESCCCRPDIMVGGPRASASSQTYCANFIDGEENGGVPRDAVDHEDPNPRLNVHCEVTKCTYNEDRACSADHIDIRTAMVNRGQVKTECATFENRSGGSGGGSGSSRGGGSGGAMNSIGHSYVSWNESDSRKGSSPGGNEYR